MGRAIMAGDDPFAQFVRDGRAALDACLDRVGSKGKVAGMSAIRSEPCLIAAVDWGILSTYLSADLFNLHSGGHDEFFPL